MTAKKFLEGKTLIAIEKIDTLILNLVVDDNELYGLAVDTSSIESGTPVTRTSDFTIDGDLLKSGNLVLDLATTEMLEG